MPPKERRKQTMAAVRKAGGDAVLVEFGPDLRWLTGFTGSSGVLAMAGATGRAALFTDGRYTAQAKAESPDLRVVVARNKRPVVALALDWLLARGATRCVLDARHTSLAALAGMRKLLPKADRRKLFLPAEGLVARLRQHKDAGEAERMRRAASLGCELYAGALGHIRPGNTEIAVALELEYAARRAGAEAMSFDTIVASGRRSALPHGRASAQRLPRRGFVTLDFGVVLDGYCSDMTRTVHLGKASRRARAVYDSVLEAQEAAIAAVGPGVPCAAVDKAARRTLTRSGLGKFFSHSTGHGVGLEIHEGPRIAAGVQQVLEPGMVVTVEPGAYLPDEFGVRIEDMVLVTEKGAEVLTAGSPKAWTEV